MQNKKTVLVDELLNAAHMELIRLGYKKSALSRHSKELCDFANYCKNNAIEAYGSDTGQQYFLHKYGLDISDPTLKLSKPQLDTRVSIRFMDDIFQFGYAIRNSHHDYTVSEKYTDLLNEYIAWCIKCNNSNGTIRVKRTKVRQFLSFMNGRMIEFSDLSAASVSEFMTTLCRYHRNTIHVYSSVLRDFFRFLYETNIIEINLSSCVPHPKIYVEETIPETWKPKEVQQVLSVIERGSAVGKRDYAMLLLAILLGMRAGDICALKFHNIDWNKKLIVYTQQKTHKVNSLPLLPVIGDAIIDYLKNGRLDSNCNNVFIRHIHPYGEFQSSTAVSECLKKYMRYAGLAEKKRKAAHSLRHTLASSLLYDGTPLMTISNILGHYSSKTTNVYTKINIPALRKCALSYGEGRESL